MNPCATILIPLLNQRQSWLEKCVRSAVAQSVPCETIVVTSPFTESGTLAHLAGLSQKNRGFMIVPQEGEGFAAAINTGIRAAEAPRVGFLLSDDWLEERAVEKCLAFDTDIVSTGFRGYDDDGRRILESISRTPSIQEFERLPTMERKASYLKHFLLFKRARLLEVGGVDETIGSTGPDDFDLPWTLLEHGATVSIVPEQLYNYRDHSGERLSLRNPESQVRDLEKILDKHGIQGTERDRIIQHHSLSYGRTYQETARLRAVSSPSDGFPSAPWTGRRPPGGQENE